MRVGCLIFGGTSDEAFVKAVSDPLRLHRGLENGRWDVFDDTVAFLI